MHTKNKRSPLTSSSQDLLNAPLPPEIRAILQRSLRIKIKPNMTWAEAMALVLCMKAAAGDVAAAKELRSSVEVPEVDKPETKGPPDIRIIDLTGSTPLSKPVEKSAPKTN